MSRMKINPFNLPFFLFKDRRQLPSDQKGVYFVLSGEKVVYVGKTTTSFFARWSGHHRAKQILEMFPDSRISYLKVDGDSAEIHQLEASFIDSFHPLLNNQPVEDYPSEPRVRRIRVQPSVFNSTANWIDRKERGALLYLLSLL